MCARSGGVIMLLWAGLAAYMKKENCNYLIGCASISFPSISTGAFGYPLDKAAGVALPTIAEVVHQRGSVTLVRFVLFDSRSHKAYAQAAQQLIASKPAFEIKAESRI